MLKSIEVKNFTVFPKASLKFAAGINIFIGENGTGKTHLLKLPYTVMAMSVEGGKKRNGPPTKTLLQTRLAEKLVNVFRPEDGRVGRLARRQQGRNRCEVSIDFRRDEDLVSFSFASQNRSEVVVQHGLSKWHDHTPVYLPTRELLTIYPGFIPLYETHHVEFEETWRDTCLLLGAPAVKGARESRVADLLGPLEEQLGGRVVLEERNGCFYLRQRGASNMEMPLVAEGWRKLAMLVRLIATGSLLDKGCLFWDEPEANLNPKLIRVVARSILDISRAGVQVFVATHSLFFLRELEVLLENEFKNVKRRFFALSRNDKGVKVSQSNKIGYVEPLILLDEDLEQSDRFIKEFMS